MHETSMPSAPIPYAHYKAEAARLRREAMADFIGRLGRWWRRPAVTKTAYATALGSGCGQ